MLEVYNICLWDSVFIRILNSPRLVSLFKECNYLFHVKESLVLSKNNGNLLVQLKCFQTSLPCKKMQKSVKGEMKKRRSIQISFSG